MPITRDQRKLFGADLSRVRQGKKGRTGMSEAQLVEMLKSGTRRKKTKRK